MNTTIESLKELYVKLGGSLEDVENKTTIPEMIDAITEVAGGDEPTYETVAEIPVGEMTKLEAVYGISVRLDKSIFDTSLKYYFNSADTPLEIVIKEDEIAGLAYNFSAEGEILGTPAYAIELGNDSAGLVSSEDLSNTTVKILKAAEEPSVLPAYDTTEDLGKVLTVTENGLAWVKP